jgi:short-subunit dehydrogenase
VAIDFTGDRTIYKAIYSELMDLDIGILINNVGINNGFCHPFTDLKDENILDDIIHW